MSGPDERRSGLGRPLGEVLEQGAPSPSPLLGALESDPVIVGVIFELLRQRFPADLVALHFELEDGVAVTRVAVGRLPRDVARDVSVAIHEVLQLQCPRLVEAGDAQIYVTPRGRESAVAVRRFGAGFSPDDCLYIDLIARHVR